MSFSETNFIPASENIIARITDNMKYCSASWGLCCIIPEMSEFIDSRYKLVPQKSNPIDVMESMFASLALKDFLSTPSSITFPAVNIR